jgi:hypothetical protein
MQSESRRPEQAIDGEHTGDVAAHVVPRAAVLRNQNQWFGDERMGEIRLD